MDIRRILVVDDHDLYRAGLRALLGGFCPSAEVREASDHLAALESIRRDGPFELVILDLVMASMPVAEGIGAVRRSAPAARILVVTASEDRADMLAALAAGANGFVGKGADTATVLRAVAVVAGGGTYVPDGAVGLPPPGRSDLSARQAEIAVLLCAGLSNKQIAGRLALAEGTVKAHLAAMMGRLGTRNRVATVVRLRALGF